MNQNELENHVKTRLGSTLTGASKEVRGVFGAGMFSIRSKQKANLFSLSLRENLKQDIKAGNLRTIEDVDSVIDKALANKNITLSKAGVDFKESLIDSATFTVTLPILEPTSRSGKTKAVATVGLGIVGWALASGTKKKHKKVKRVRVTLHENGLQIHNAAPDGSNLRIEWGHIINAPQDGKKIQLNLKDGTIIDLKANIQVTRETVEKISQHINKNAHGTIDNGWN